jgi:tetratricopeptide (TPR) repeat protein
MRATFKRVSGGMIGKTALALALSTGALTVGATAAFAKEKEPKVEKASYSKEFVGAAAPIQKTMNALDEAKKKGADAAAQKALVANAPAELAAAEAAIKTPLDRMAAGGWAVSLGGTLNDIAMRQRGMQNMLDSGQVPAANVTEYQFYLGNFAYSNKDFPAAVKALTAVVAANYKDDTAAELLADSYSQQGQNAEALAALKAAVDARKAAGGAVPEGWFKRANLIAYKSKLGPQAIEWSTMMVENDPTPINWLGAGQLVREFGQFTNQESLDLGRLLLRSGGFQNDPKYVEREYIEYIEAADPRRLPGEVLKVTDMGVKSGVLKANDPFVSDALSQSKGRIAADKASLPALDKEARAGKDGKSALAMADAYLSYDEPAKAEEMYKMAIAKGAIDKDRALTRLGIAQIDQDKFEDAKASFAQVTGARAPLARLWATFATTQARP